MEKVCDNPVCPFWSDEGLCTAPDNIYDNCSYRTSNLALKELAFKLEKGWKYYSEQMARPVSIQVVHMKYPPFNKNIRFI